MDEIKVATGFSQVNLGKIHWQLLREIDVAIVPEKIYLDSSAFREWHVCSITRPGMQIAGLEVSMCVGEPSIGTPDQSFLLRIVMLSPLFSQPFSKVYKSDWT